MITAETALAFFLASVLLALTPGPDNLFVLMQSAVNGRRAGVLVTLGLCTGLLVHTTAVALGVAAIFQTSQLAFDALKTIGACYLLWLAWQLLRADAQHLRDSTARVTPGPWALYRRGIVMNVTNAKVSIFFLAFLPQFANPQAGNVSVQIVVLGGVFIAATVLVFGAIALLSGSVARALIDSSRGQRIMNRLAAVVFIGLALKLITTER